MRRVGDVLVAVLCLTFLLPGCAAKTTRASDNTSAPIPIVLFASETCGECLEVSGWLEGLIASGVRIDVRRFSDDNVTSASLRHVLDLACGVPEEQWYLVPAVFVGRTALIRGDVIEGQLPEIIRQTTSEDAAFLLDQLEATQSASNVPRQQADDAHRASCMMVVFASLPSLGLLRQPHRQPKD